MEEDVHGRLIREVIIWQAVLGMKMPAEDPLSPTRKEVLPLAEQICAKIEHMKKVTSNPEFVSRLEAATQDMSEDDTIQLWALLIALSISRPALGTCLQEVFDWNSPGRIDGIKEHLRNTFPNLKNYPERLDLCSDAAVLMIWLIIYRWGPTS